MHRSFLGCCALSICSGLFVLGLLCLGRAQEVPTKVFEFHHENVLGTSLELRIQCADSGQAQRAEAAALERIDQLNMVFSTYRPDSQLSRFIGLEVGASMQVDPLLCRVLKQCENWKRISHGAFEPSVQGLSQRWKGAVEQGVVPSTEELKELAKRIAQPQWSVDIPSSVITRLGTEPITLNAIAKGTILDAVAESIQEVIPDLKLGSINIGGDIRIVGQSKQLVSIPHPRTDALGAKPMLTVQLENRGVATSGNSERFFSIQGVKYSHLIDPRNGQPCDSTCSATVIAPDAQTADVLATICCVLQPAAALQLIESIPGSAACIVAAQAEPSFTSRWPRRQCRMISRRIPRKMIKRRKQLDMNSRSSSR